MRDILYGIMVASLCAGVVCFLSPEGKRGEVKKQIGFAVSVGICLALIVPLKSAIADTEGVFMIPEFSDTSHTLSERADAVLCGELEYAVAEKFGIKNARIVTELDDSDPQSLRLISAELYGEGNLSAAAEYLSELLGTRVTVGEEQ